MRSLNLVARWDTIANKLRGDLTLHRYYRGICMVMDDLTPSDWIIDVGCGQGKALKILRDLGFSLLVGIDISPKIVRIAKSLTKEVDFVVGDVHHLPFRKNIFRFIFSFDSIEHWKSPEEGVYEIHRICVDNGNVILTTDTFVWRIIQALHLPVTQQPIDKALSPSIYKKIFAREFRLQAYIVWGYSLPLLIILEMQTLMMKFFSLILRAIQRILKIDLIRAIKKIYPKRSSKLMDPVEGISFFRKTIRHRNQFPTLHYLLLSSHVAFALSKRALERH